MGKYDTVLTALRPVPPPSYQDKIDEAKIEITGTTATELAALYTSLRQEKRDAESELQRVNITLEAVTQLLVASQESGAEGWGQYGTTDNTLRLVTGDKIAIQREPYGQVKDKESFRLWCLANGYGGQLQLWPTTMNAIVKERLLAGEELPDGCEVFAKDKIVYTQFKEAK